MKTTVSDRARRALAEALMIAKNDGATRLTISAWLEKEATRVRDTQYRIDSTLGNLIRTEMLR